MDGHFIRKQVCLVFLVWFDLAFWTISSYFFLTTRKKGQYIFFSSLDAGTQVLHFDLWPLCLYQVYF